MTVTLYRGSEAQILSLLQSEGRVWVRGAAKVTVARMKKKGLIDYSAEAICDNRTSRSHEEFFVWLCQSEEAAS